MRAISTFLLDEIVSPVPYTSDAMLLDHRMSYIFGKTQLFLAETQNQHLQHFPLYSWQLRAEMAHYVAHGRYGPVLSEGKLIELKYLLLSSFSCLQFMLTWSDSVLG